MCASRTRCAPRRARACGRTIFRMGAGDCSAAFAIARRPAPLAQRRALQEACLAEGKFSEASARRRFGDLRCCGRGFGDSTQTPPWHGKTLRDARRAHRRRRQGPRPPRGPTPQPTPRGSTSRPSPPRRRARCWRASGAARRAATRRRSSSTRRRSTAGRGVAVGDHGRRAVGRRDDADERGRGRRRVRRRRGRPRVPRGRRRRRQSVLNASAARNGGSRAAAATKVERAAAAKAAKARSPSRSRRARRRRRACRARRSLGARPAVGVADVAQLLSLGGGGDAHMRFARDEIYSWGLAPPRVNPYKKISGMYGEAAMAKFSGRGLLNNPPHIYAIAEEAIRKARHGGGAQSLIISGESGAGKTETNKLALAYIVWRSQGGKGQSMLTTRILQANPLLETLGNAKTARNSNSSRFGKCGCAPTPTAARSSAPHTYLGEVARRPVWGAGATSTSSTSCSPSSRRRRSAPPSRPAWRWRAPAAADSAGRRVRRRRHPPSSASATSTGGASPAESALLSSPGAHPGGDRRRARGRTRRRRSRRWLHARRAARSSRCSLPSSTSRTRDDDAKGAAKTMPGCAAAPAAAHVLGASNLETLLTVRKWR